MADGGEPYRIRLANGVGSLAAEAWDACAGDGNPFLSHAFLTALEDSGSVGGNSGWSARPLLVEDANGRLLAAAPLYVKSHSYGEYVFDQGWAQAYERAGGRYYPKLLVAVPFTPVPGPRLLVRPGAEAARAATLLVEGLVAVAKQLEVSSLHANFVGPEDAAALGGAGFLLRHGHQYHWRNDAYADFEGFLGALTARKRKAIRKERREVAESGIRLLRLTGQAIEPRHWAAFFRCYIATSEHKWGHPYLTRRFFELLGERMADRVMLVMAEDRGRPVAGALNLIGRDRLYGRNWGCDGDYRFLHFEACYYQAVEFAIERGLAVVEAGAQGEHKIQRGYLPVETTSAHWIADPRFRDAVADFLRRETAAIRAEIAGLGEYSPFRKEGQG
ncbi:MAG: GNAT family N-acetyltransferase [Dongiaceae bacterium]